MIINKNKKIGMFVDIPKIMATDGHSLVNFHLEMTMRPETDNDKRTSSTGEEYIKDGQFFKKIAKSKKLQEELAKKMFNDVVPGLFAKQGKTIDGKFKVEFKIKVFYSSDN